MKTTAKYKIVKVAGLSPSTDRYFVYRRVFFFWKLLKSEWTQKEAEQVVANDKRYILHRKAKPELIGYY
jgi:hypothetical protein